MAQSRKSAEVDRDRRNISRLYLQGELQADIGEQLGISQSTVSRDLKVVQKQWAVERVEDFNERKNIELAKVDNLELEYWLAWKRSQEDAEVQTVKQKGAIVDGDKKITPIEAQKRTEAQAGDPRYLAGIQWCINKRCELLGLDAPTKEEETGVNDIVNFSIPAYLIAPSFFNAYRDIKDNGHLEYVFSGGRGSTKSSFISLAGIDVLINNPNMHWLATRQVGNTLRDSVFSQIRWAIMELGLEDKFKSTVNPLEIEYIPTGQKIYFRGGDDPIKIKSIKPVFGYIGILWLEELDQFRGQEAVRNIEQSAIRGGDVAYIFKSFNAPRTAANWANKYVKIPKANQYLHFSNYKDVPKEWLGIPWLEEAEHLKLVNPDAYEHEYGGIANGTGGLVFENTVIRAITDEEIAQFDRVLHGLDWGYFPHPLSYGKMYYDATRMKLYIYGEYRCLKGGNKKTYNAIQKHGYNPNDLIIADSAEPKSVADYREYGANVRGAEKGDGSVDYSMKWLQSLHSIIIDDRRAPYHAEEFLNYELEKNKNDEFISAYPDKNNHAIDDTRYATNLIWRRRGQ